MGDPEPQDAAPPGGGNGGPDTASDPTDVIGRRIVAHLIDTLVYGAAFVAPFLALATRTRFESLTDDEYRFELAGGQAALRLGEDVWFMADTEFYTVLGIGFGVFLVLEVFLQGLAGFTVGKLVTGLRTIDGDGYAPGVGRAFVRTLFWLVDSLPVGFAVPLLGFVTAVASSSSRRLGDMAARTFVVDRRAKGKALRTAVEPEAVEIEPDDQDPFDDDRGAQRTDWRAGEWADDQPATESGGEAQPDTPDPARYDPEWDPERGTYVQWDPRNERWLAFDQDTDRWVPTDR